MKTKKNNAPKKVAKKEQRTSQATVPYLEMYDSGMTLNNANTYSRTYFFPDMNFDTEPEEVQESILRKFGKVLNKFGPNVTAQYSIINKKIPLETVKQNYHIRPRDDEKQDYRDEYNSIVDVKIEEGKNDVQKGRYITLSVLAPDIIIANRTFNTLEIALQEAMSEVNGAGVHLCEPEERITLLHDIFWADKDPGFTDRLDKYRGNDGVFSLSKLSKRGMTTKDLICPPLFENGKKHVDFNNGILARTFLISDLPSTIDTKFVSEISNIPCEMIVSIVHRTKPKKTALRDIKIHSNSIKSEVVKAQQNAIKNNYDPSLISESLVEAREEADFLIKDLTINNQKPFFTTMTITLFASSMEELDELTDTLQMKAGDFSCQIIILAGQQMSGLQTSLPFGETFIEVDRLLTTEAACGFFPFSVQELMDKSGHFYGINAYTKSMIMYDRRGSELPNGMIFGKSGSGKSFFVKGEIIPNILDTEDDIIILDPDGEYVVMANEFNGTVIDLSTKADKYINPLDMDMEYGDPDADPLTEKCDFMVGLVEAVAGREGVDAYGIAAIHRCTKRIYEPYIEHMDRLHESGSPTTCDTEACPTLRNFYEALYNDNTAEGQRLAMLMEPYCVGQYDIFAHKTNIDDVNSRILVYNLRKMPKKMREFAMKVCLPNIWNRVIQNRALGKATWVYLDEMYLLCQSESCATILQEYYKRIRKYFGIMTGITQDVEDLLKTSEGRGIFNNCGFCVMMKQSKIGREELATQFSIPESLKDYLHDKPAGVGVIYNGHSLVPFNYRSPDDSKLYKLMSTKPTDGDFVSAPKETKKEIALLVTIYREDGKDNHWITRRLMSRYNLPESSVKTLMDEVS